MNAGKEPLRGRVFLERIWNLEHVHRPGVIVEEVIPRGGNAAVDTGGTVADDALFDNAYAYYQALKNSRDDNEPALNCAFGTYVIPTAFGAPVKQFEDGRTYVTAPVIHTPSDVDRIKPLPLEETLLGRQIDLVAAFAKKLDASGSRAAIRIPDIQNPLGVAEMLWESDNFYISLLDSPAQVHKLLRMILEVTVEYIARVKKLCRHLNPISWPWVWAPEGRGVYLADDSMSMVSPQLYEAYGVHYNNQISRAFGGLMLHSCVVRQSHFESIAKNEGLRSLNFAAQYSDDLADIYQFFGGKAVLLPHYVHTDSPQIGTVAEFVDKVMSVWRPGTPTIIYVSPRPDGGAQQQVFDRLACSGGFPL